jgi:hypothetical protein
VVWGHEILLLVVYVVCVFSLLQNSVVAIRALAAGRMVTTVLLLTHAILLVSSYS